MKIKDTVYTEMDRHGKVTGRKRVLEFEEDLDQDCDQDREYDRATRCGEPEDFPTTSFDRIWAAYVDYRKSQQW